MANLNLKAKLQNISDKKNELVHSNKYLSFFDDIHRRMKNDNAEFKVGAITYYMFLSIPPLLLFSLTIFDMIFESDPQFRDRVIESTFSTIPVVGTTLESNLSFVQARGLTLFLSLALMLWAIRKGTIALQSALCEILKQNDLTKERNLIEKNLRAYLIMLIIAVGLFLPTFFNSIALNNVFLGSLVLVLSSIWNTAIVYLIFLVTVDHKSAKGWGVLFSGISVTLIQFLSVFIIGNSIDNSRPLYGTLAVVLALLIWLSLQIRSLVYGALINSVLTK